MRPSLITVCAIALLASCGCYDADSSAPSSIPTAAQSVSYPSPKPIQHAVPARKPKMPPAVKAYLSKVSEEIGHLANELHEIKDRASEAANNLNMLSDENWLTKTDIASDAVTNIGQRMMHNSPVPGECRAIQRKIARLGNTSISVARQFAAGARQRDLTTLERSENSMLSVTEQEQDLTTDVLSLRNHYEP